MPGKCRPSLRAKTLDNVMRSNLSVTDKECIKAVFDLNDVLQRREAEPVRHGRWESVKNPQWPAYSHDKCNLCGWWNTKNALCYDGNKKPGHSLNYCPNCGAKMDGDSHD